MAQAAEWAERIRAWQESGLRAEEFASGKDFRAKTLVWWSSELKRRAKRAGGETRPKRARKRRAEKGVKMARVIATPGESPSGLTLRVGGAAVEVHRGFDRELLSELLSVLGGSR